MVVADSSVWIDYLGGRASRETQLLDDLLTREFVLTGDLILAEVLQGIRDDAQFRATLRAMNRLPFSDMLGREIAVLTARNHRKLRKRGVTVRKTIDLIIASFCAHNGHQLLHSDRDFDKMAPHMGLRTL